MNMNTKGKKEHVRTINLLGSGTTVVIKVREWLKAGVDSFAKEFDSNNTTILRIWRHRDGAGFMIYGMRSKGGVIVNEASELVPIEGMVDHALDQVSEHCDLEDLREQVSL